MKRAAGSVTAALQTSIIALVFTAVLLGLKGLLLIVNSFSWHELLLVAGLMLAITLMLAWWEQL